MKSLLLMSVIIVTIVAPLLAARDPDAVRGARRLFVSFTMFCVVYALYVTYVHPLFVPTR
jgi:hypothetical protein